MIKKEEIYFHTRGGLDVFRLLWDDAARVIDNGDLTKPFKRRQDERTASCHFKRKSGKDGEYWLATDFGDDQQPRNCFDWVIREFHLQGFKEACAWIVTNLNLDIYDIKPETNKPERIEVVETDAPNHTVLFELREDDVFTDAELETFGPLVTNEVMSDLNWHPVLWCGVAKDGKVRRSYSCDSYPIYARECITADPKTGEKKSSFWKIYKPLDMDTGDFCLHADEKSGKAYIWFERPHFQLICATLTDDYTAVTDEYSVHYDNLLPPDTREAPTFFERGGRKYLITSGTSGYYPNPSRVCL